MSLDNLVSTVSDKENFLTLAEYINFCERYLDFVSQNLQAVIVSQNETHYQFYQYKADGYFNITRPLNPNLMYTAENGSKITKDFLDILGNIHDISEGDAERRSVIIRAIYTIQQCIGAALDALPSGQSNRARKVNGDLFERMMVLLVRYTGVKCETGTIQVPVEVDGEEQFCMNYQHDLLIYNGDKLKAIGSVKTSSKDRLGKIFMDKFLYSKLTDTLLPHIAIFLNDVQRKKTRKENQYGINATFLPGRFKGFTVKLNPLDGVYYCDIRPNIQRDALLKNHIQTIDHFFCSDLWTLLERRG